MAGGTGFQQQDAIALIRRQPVGDDGSGRSGADNDIVVSSHFTPRPDRSPATPADTRLSHATERSLDQLGGLECQNGEGGQPMFAHIVPGDMTDAGIQVPCRGIAHEVMTGIRAIQ
jgi:hypothetical protein